MDKQSIRAKKIAQSYANNLLSHIAVEALYLFGSAARGTMHKESDLDVMIVSKDFEHTPFIERAIQLNRLRNNDALTTAMDIIGVTPKEFKQFKTHQSSALRQIYREAVRVVF